VTITRPAGGWSRKRLLIPDTAKTSHNWRGHDVAERPRGTAADCTKVIVAGAFKLAPPCRAEHPRVPDRSRVASRSVKLAGPDSEKYMRVECPMLMPRATIQKLTCGAIDLPALRLTVRGAAATLHLTLCCRLPSPSAGNGLRRGYYSARPSLGASGFVSSCTRPQSLSAAREQALSHCRAFRHYPRDEQGGRDGQGQGTGFCR
jgi:hypothetical protein